MSCTPAFQAWRATRRILPPLIVLALAAIPLAGQSHRAALGVTGGWSSSGDLTPGFAEETVLESGWTAGLQLETWLGSGRFGVRSSGSYADRADRTDARHTVISGDLALLTRLLPARAGRAVAPYIALGAGAVHFRSAEGAEPIGGGLYGPGPVTRAVAVAGLGVDLLSASRVGLRIEAGDQIVLLSVGESPDRQGLPTAHNLHLSTALQLRLGQLPYRPGSGPEGPPPAPAASRVAPPRAPATATPAGPESAKAAADPGTTRTATPTPKPAPVPTPAPTPAAPTPTSAAPATAAPAPTPASSPATAPQVRYTVQVGALVEPETARRWAERVRERKIPVWMTPVSVQGQEFMKVRIGVLGSESEAHGLAGAIMRRYGWAVSVDRVTAEDRPPAGAQAATRAYLYGG